MFAAPPEQSLEWSDSGVEGAHRFLKRLWTFAYENKSRIHQQNRLTIKLLNSSDWEKTDPAQTDIFRQVYEILDQIKFDYERQQFNTVVSSCMKILNLLTKIPDSNDAFIDIRDIIIHEGFSILLRLLAPITPHITHQLWQDLHYPDLILDACFPRPSPVVFKVDTIEMVVQVNGKLRSRIRVPYSADKETIEEKVKADEKVQFALQGKEIKKIITVPKKLLNVVTGE
jgi:leucyl-tRNA synthetase